MLVIPPFFISNPVVNYLLTILAFNFCTI